MKKIVIIVITGILAGFTSCSDVLDTTPYNKPSSSTMWTTENFTHMGIAGIYQALRQAHLIRNSNSFGWFAFDAMSETGQSRDIDPLLNGTINTSNGQFSGTWQRLYEGIHRANDAIANMPEKSPVSNALKAQYVAEAKFLRALFYYKLNELYRGVPIYLEPVEVDECIKGQDSESAVWEQVIKDLTECINEPEFPDIDLSDGKATRGAAYALRGKTYMQMKQWENAIADFAKVGDCGYELFQGGYKELFTEDNERCREMIFSMQNITQSGYGGSQQRYLGSLTSLGENWNNYIPSSKGVDMYENADGTPFNWDDIIPGYNAMTPSDREVFFLRDTRVNGQEISSTVTDRVQGRLNTFSADVSARYLPEGNEARIRQAYTNRDPRLEMNVITPYAEFLGVFQKTSTEVMTVSRWPSISTVDFGDMLTDTQAYFYYLYRKFVVEGNKIPDYNRGGIDEPLIRYADVILQWAEALVELNRLPEAAEKVNMIRGRASVNMPPVQYADQSELREKVRKERRVELMNEGISFFDDMRWRTWAETKFSEGNGIQHIWGAIISAYVYQGDFMYTWPVPATEVEMNPNLVKTPGWIY